MITIMVSEGLSKGNGHGSPSDRRDQLQAPIWNSAQSPQLGHKAMHPQ